MVDFYFDDWLSKRQLAKFNFLQNSPLYGIVPGYYERVIKFSLVLLSNSDIIYCVFMPNCIECFQSEVPFWYDGSPR